MCCDASNDAVYRGTDARTPEVGTDNVAAEVGSGGSWWALLGAYAGPYERSVAWTGHRQ